MDALRRAASARFDLESPSMKPRILLTEPLDAASERRLEKRSTVIRPKSSAEEEWIRLVRDCDAIIARSSSRITRRVIEAAVSLHVIGAASVGIDHIDTAAAGERGIKIINTPDANADAAAEFTVALICQLLRPIPVLSAAYRRGEFNVARRESHGPELHELTVGIIGMGRVGSRVGRICAAGFGATVLYNDIVPVGPFSFAARSVEKSVIWSDADIVTLHAPLTDATRGLIQAPVFTRMRPSAFLINVARGPIVRTPDLVEALSARRIAGAALDVTDPEPLPPDHPLWQFDNCLITPHVAARTHGGLRRMYDVVDDVLESLGV